MLQRAAGRAPICGDRVHELVRHWTALFEKREGSVGGSGAGRGTGRSHVHWEAGSPGLRPRFPTPC